MLSVGFRVGFKTKIHGLILHLVGTVPLREGDDGVAPMGDETDIPPPPAPPTVHGGD